MRCRSHIVSDVRLFSIFQFGRAVFSTWFSVIFRSVAVLVTCVIHLVSVTSFVRGGVIVVTHMIGHIGGVVLVVQVLVGRVAYIVCIALVPCAIGVVVLLARAV